MLGLIRTQQTRIETLEGRVAHWKDRHTEAEGTLKVVRARVQSLIEETDNLRLELSARPTVKALREKEIECGELEARLRDVIVMRNESAELAGMKKHMVSICNSR